MAATAKRRLRPDVFVDKLVTPGARRETREITLLVCVCVEEEERGTSKLFTDAVNVLSRTGLRISHPNLGKCGFQHLES